MHAKEVFTPSPVLSFPSQQLETDMQVNSAGSDIVVSFLSVSGVKFKSGTLQRVTKRSWVGQ